MWAYIVQCTVNCPLQAYLHISFFARGPLGSHCWRVGKRAPYQSYEPLLRAASEIVKQKSSNKPRNTINFVKNCQFLCYPSFMIDMSYEVENERFQKVLDLFVIVHLHIEKNTFSVTFFHLTSDGLLNWLFSMDLDCQLSTCISTSTFYKSSEQEASKNAWHVALRVKQGMSSISKFRFFVQFLLKRTIENHYSDIIKENKNT